MYQNILVAVDGSEESEYALQRAIELAKKHESVIHLIHVLENYRYPGDTGSLRKEKETFGKQLLQKLQKQAEEQGAKKVETIFDFGHPRSIISKKYAKQVEADLIVCGATGANAVQRLIGSVSEYIVRTARCDVLIARMPEDKVL
ncbi:universal stress protein [Ornithinibacillus sp. 4-3]|uniref:Universal stress protein n=1 Tax=Ornithinibacillus sp. 4-3 TaxID=3231488 RepID=A0AB39HVK8_9BACI